MKSTMIVSLMKQSVQLIETTICVTLEDAIIRLVSLIMAGKFRDTLVHSLKRRGKTVLNAVRRIARSTKI